jgi:hypothetical protein
MRGTAQVRRDIPVFYDTYQALCAQGVQFPPFDPTLGPSLVDRQSGDPGQGIARSAGPGFFFCRGSGHGLKSKF